MITSLFHMFIVPSRPHELKLPSELVYTSSNCTDSDSHSEVRTKFQATLLTLIRLQDACSMSPKDCIVDDVITNCLSARSRYRLVAKRRRRNFPSITATPLSTNAGAVETSTALGTNVSADVSVHTTRRRKKTIHRRHTAGGGGGRRPFFLSIQFHLATRLPSSGGDWPDEYHRATHRLFSLFDYLEQQVKAATFSISHRVHGLHIREVNDSLTYAPMKTICDLGYSFNPDILLCGRFSCLSINYGGSSVNYLTL